MSKPTYFVIDVKITDLEGMKPYQAKVEETYTDFGGERVVAGGIPVTLEGEAPQGRIVIVRFPSLEHAHAWHASPAYQSILGYRLASSECQAYFVEGVAAE